MRRRHTQSPGQIVAALGLACLVGWPLTASAQKNFEQPPQMGTPSAPNATNTQRNARFTLINDSSQIIDNLNISPVRDDSWGDDLMGNLALPPRSRIIAGPTQDTGCTFDVRVVFHDQREEIMRRQNLCTLQELTFTGRNARPTRARARARE